jgi:uncharacterized protein
VFDKTDLIRLVSVTIPFGKFQGRVIMDLPEEYLLWFQRKGFPDGDLGQLMALALDIKVNGLEDILMPLRKQTQPQTATQHKTRH